MSIRPNAATPTAAARIVAPSRRASRTRQLEPAAEEVGRDRRQIVAEAEQHAVVGRAAAEHVLRQQRVDDDEAP